LQSPDKGTLNIKEREMTAQVRAMIIDDSHLVCDVVERILALEPDINLIAKVSSAQDACIELSKNDIDVILLDLGLPDADGLQLLDLFTVKDTCGVVVLSGGAVHRETALALGATAYFEKAELFEHRDQFAAAIRKAGGKGLGPRR
jgi:DNA-binding NarL/FixJ family response regulator